MQNNYEIIGNQIRFYFKGDTTHMWNRVSSPEYRTEKEIEMWCSHVDSALSHWNCTMDGRHQNLMTQTEVTDFLYRWITAYIKMPADATKAELKRIIHDDVFWNMTKEIGMDLAGLALQAAQIAIDCIMFMIEWGGFL